MHSNNPTPADSYFFFRTSLTKTRARLEVHNEQVFKVFSLNMILISTFLEKTISNAKSQVFIITIFLWYHNFIIIIKIELLFYYQLLLFINCTGISKQGNTPSHQGRQPSCLPSNASLTDTIKTLEMLGRVILSAVQSLPDNAICIFYGKLDLLSNTDALADQSSKKEQK